MKFKKFTALLTAACFLAAFTGQSFAVSSGSLNENISAAAAPAVFAERFGKITEVENYDSPQAVVSIQDLHSHPQTQKNIASILRALDEKYHVKRVYTEGASGKVDISWLAGGGLNKEIVAQMIENGNLTGTEYYAYLNNKDNIFGLEDAAVHRQNIARLGGIYENREKNLAISAAVKNEIDYLADKNLNGDMKKLAKASAAYHGNKMKAAQYYKILLDYAGIINLNPQNYDKAFNINPQEFGALQKVVLIDSLSKKINAKHVHFQLQKYLSELKNKISVSEFYALMEVSDNLNDIDAFFRHVSERGFAVFANPELASFFKIRELNSSINPLDLFAQEQRLEELLRRALSASELEREISFIKDFYVFFDGYLTNKLTAKDEEYFKANFEKFASLYAKYASVNHISGIKDQVSFINDYYEANNRRNEIFVEKINENENLVSGKESSFKSAEEILGGAKEIIVIVTGGYHTLGVNNILDSKKISRITITPKISESAALSDINYRRIIIEQGRLYREALSFVIASQTSDAQKFKNIIEAGASYLGKDTGFDDLDLLAGKMADITGNVPELRRVDGDNAEMIFANGAVISLTRGAGNNIELVTEKSAAAETVDGQAVAISGDSLLGAYFGLAKTLIPAAFKSLYGVAVLDIENESVYRASKKFFTEQSAAGADFGVDGAVPELEEYARSFVTKRRSFDNVKASLQIDSIPYQLLSRMPEFFQKAALLRQAGKDGQKAKRPWSRRFKIISLLLMLTVVAPSIAACAQNQAPPSVQSPAVSSPLSPDAQQNVRVPVDVNYIKRSRVENGKIVITDEKGRLIEYVIKGVCYSRDRQGQNYGEFYRQDLPLLKDLGINSIRTYRPFAVYENGKMDIAQTREMLDAFQKEGITVTVGFSYDDMAAGGLMEEYLRNFGDHPAILTIALGNEYNYHYGEWFTKEEWMARLSSASASAAKLAPNKIIAVVHGEMPTADEVKEYKERGIMLILLNMYRGGTFTGAQRQWETLGTGMPWVLGEFGRSSKAGDGTDTSDVQEDFIKGQIEGLGDSGGYLFEAFDNPEKEGAINETIGAENSLGIFTYDGNRKPAADTVEEKYSENASGRDGYLIDGSVSASPSASAPATAAPSSVPAITKEKSIDFSIQAYSGQNWHSYALNLGVVNIGADGEIVLNIKTETAAANPAAKIEIRNTDESGVPDASSNIILEQTYNLAAEGETVQIRIPYESIKSLDFSKPVEAVISTGVIFGGDKLNEKTASVSVKSASVRSARLELPIFAYILNRLSITKDKYPKTRAAVIAALEAPLMLLLSPKSFVGLHGESAPEVYGARLKAAAEMKEKAKKLMSAGAAFGAAVVAVSALLSLIAAFLLPVSGMSLLFFSLYIFSSSLVIQLPLLVAAPLIAGLVSLARNHFSWNLANPKAPLDTNVKINMIYALNARNLEILSRKYETGPVINRDGTVSQNIFILNEKMSPSELAGFSNSGISVGGTAVWVSKSRAGGIIYYAEGIAPEEISEAVQNRKLEKIVSAGLKEAKVFLDNKMSADYLEVDAASRKTGTEYDAVTGNAKLYLGGSMEMLPYGTADLNRARDIRDAEGWQRAGSIMVFLDKAKTVSGFENYLKILGNASNGNIIITEELALKLSASGTLNAVLEQLRKDGISIMVSPKQEGSALTAGDMNLFDGKFSPLTGEIETAVAGDGKIAFKADLIKEGGAMEESLGLSNKNIVIFESAIEDYVRSDRAGLGKFLEEITSSKIIKYFASAEITAETAKETARNFDIETIMRDFPLITESDIAQMYEALRQGRSAEEIFALNERINVGSGARLYLQKIDARAQDKTAAARIKKSYMEGLLEKFAACAEFKKAGRSYGFKNKNTEKLVGRLASFKYLKPASPFARDEAAASAIKAKADAMTAKNYNNEITAIINESPEAVPLAAELLLEMIFAYESDVKTDKKDFRRAPDLKAMNAILSAA